MTTSSNEVSMATLMHELFEQIAHGDERHRDWLRSKLEDFGRSRSDLHLVRYSTEQRPLDVRHAALTPRGLELGGVVSVVIPPQSPENVARRVPTGVTASVDVTKCGESAGFGPQSPCLQPVGHEYHEDEYHRKWTTSHFDPVGDLFEFMEQFGPRYYGPPRSLPPDLAAFRQRFLREEVAEYVLASNSDDRPGQLDALVDLVYVAVGTCYLHGYDFASAWVRVHEANMRKERAPESEGKWGVVKPLGWTPPDLTDLTIAREGDS